MAETQRVDEYINNLVAKGLISEAVAQSIRELGLTTYEEVDIALVEAGNYGSPDSIPASAGVTKVPVTGGETGSTESDTGPVTEVQAAKDRVWAAVDRGQAPAEEDLAILEQGGLTDEMLKALDAAQAKSEYEDMLAGLNNWFKGGNIWGTLDDLDLDELRFTAKSMFGMDNTDFLAPDPSGRLTTQERLDRGTAAFFSNQNMKTQQIMEAWAQENERYLTQEDQQVYKAMEITNETFGRTQSIVTAGRAQGLAPEESARVWSIASDRGLIMDPDTTREVFARYADPVDAPRPGVTERHLTNVGVYEEYQAGMSGKLFGQVAKRFSDAKEEYGSEIVAYVAIEDPDLARRMYNDPYSLTMEEILAVDKMIGGATNWAGVPGESLAANWLQDRMAGQQQVIRVDETGAMEAARTLASAWNLPELSDGLLRSIAQGQTAANVAALRETLGNPFKPELVPTDPRVANVPSPYAAAAEALRGTAIYEELFKNRRSGESEEDYAGRFTAAVQKVLGDSDPVMARRGMRTGSTKTIGQSALASGEGFESSTFLERLAGMGNAFKEMT
jgi:hypothetical protein